jgi:hypothetical protein
VEKMRFAVPKWEVSPNDTPVLLLTAVLAQTEKMTACRKSKRRAFRI